MAAHSSPAPGRVLAEAVVSGIVTALLPPARIPVRARRWMHAGLGLAAAGATTWVLGRPDGPVTPPEGPITPPEDEQDAPATELLPVPARLAVGSLVGLLVTLCSVGGVWLDSAAEDALRRRGVRHPRWWIGVAATALTAAMSWAEGPRDARSRDR